MALYHPVTKLTDFYIILPRLMLTGELKTVVVELALPPTCPESSSSRYRWVVGKALRASDDMRLMTGGVTAHVCLTLLGLQSAFDVGGRVGNRCHETFGKDHWTASEGLAWT